MVIRRRHTFSLIFLIFFCCYVISPFCYVDSRSNVNFLINKARAVLSSNSIEKISFAKYLLSFAANITNAEGYYASTDKLSSPSPDSGHILTFSGLSPPLLT